MTSKPNAADDAFDSKRADDEAAAIAAERLRNGAADDKEDGTEALESLGISFTGETILQRLEHQPATLAEFEAAHGPVRPPDADG
jgi:hypothetical protein